MLLPNHLLCDISQAPARFTARQPKLCVRLLFGNSMKGLENLLGLRRELALLDFLLQFRQHLFEHPSSLRGTQNPIHMHGDYCSCIGINVIGQESARPLRNF